MFNYSQYLPQDCSQRLTVLIAQLKPIPLGPGSENRDILPQLEDLSLDDICPADQRTDDDLASCCIAGLWLIANYLERGHACTQGLPSASGSYWHAIMHRREPDYGNSAYWFRKTAAHDIFPQLLEACQQEFPNCILSKQDHWNPEAFNELCENNINGGADQDLCMDIQLLEWCILFGYSYAGARR